MAPDPDFEIRFFESVHSNLPNDPQVIDILGSLYTQHGRIDEGLEMDRKAIRLSPDNPNAYYNLACSLTLKTQKKEALEALGKAIDLGYDDLKWLLEDPDLKSLHNDPQFEALINKLRENEGI